MRSFLISLSLVLVTAAVYCRVYQFDFVHFDDADFVYSNPHITTGLSRANVIWAMTSCHVGNYIPLTRLSWMLSIWIFGLSPGELHIENVCLHLISSVLVFFLLKNATGRIWPSAFVAFVFALHPTRTESVVWISERKDVLSTMLVLTSMILYVRWTKAAASKKSLAIYWAMVVCFLFAMLSKQMLVTMPFLLILLDFWPLDRARLGLRKLVVEKIPLFLIMFAAVFVSYYAAKEVVQSANAVPIGFRLENVFVSYVRYIFHILWPVDLSPFYPFQNSWPAWKVLGSIVLLISISLICLRLGKTRRYVLIGWLWFLGILVPCIGLISVGPQSIADRWLYVPIIGLTVMITWLAADWSETRGRGIQRAVIAIAALLLGIFSMLTYKQIGYWRNTRTLFTHALTIINSAPEAHMQIASLALQEGDKKTALAEYTLAAQFAPDDFEPEFNLGNLLLDEPEQAIGHYQRALTLKPHHPQVENNFAIALIRVGRPDMAYEMLRSAINDDPEYADPHANLGLLLTSAGKLDAAAAEFKEALRIDPENAIALRAMKSKSPAN